MALQRGTHHRYASLPQLASQLLAEKLGNLAERDGGLGQAIIEQVLRVRLAFVDLELRLHPGRAERAMHPHRVAQQQVACAGGQDGWRESVHIAVDRRYQGFLQVVAVGIHYRCTCKPEHLSFAAKTLNRAAKDIKTAS